MREGTAVATIPNCRMTIVRSPVDSTDSASQTLEFIVWPEQEPHFEGILIDIDNTEQTEWTFGHGERFTIRLSEMKYPEGFAWKEPTHVFQCATITEDQSVKTGYKQYFVVAGATDCSETFTLERADWWTVAPLSFAIKINVGGTTPPVECLDGAVKHATTNVCVCPDPAKFYDAQQGKCIDSPTPNCADGLFWDGFECVTQLPTGDLLTVSQDQLYVRIPLNYKQVVTTREEIATGEVWRWD
jgi:hypothetical protein